MKKSWEIIWIKQETCELGTTRSDNQSVIWQQDSFHYPAPLSKSAISIKMQSYCRKVRRASTPLTACLSQNGGHHLVWPQRRVPPSKVLEHLLEEAGWRLVLPPAHERLTNNATKPGALHAHLDILLTLADLVRSARPNASRFPITLTAPRLSSATSAQRTPEIDKTA